MVEDPSDESATNSEKRRRAAIYPTPLRLSADIWQCFLRVYAYRHARRKPPWGWAGRTRHHSPLSLKVA